MSVIGDFTIPTAQFALGQTLRNAPLTGVRFERLVTHGQERIMPFLWVTGDDREDFHRTIDSDPTVVSASVTDDFDVATLYSIWWDDSIKQFVDEVFHSRGTLVDAVGRRSTWDIRVRFEDQEDLGAIQHRFSNGNDTFSLNRLFTPSEPLPSTYSLTPVQRETIVTAHEVGYFDVPRTAHLSDLADDLHVSANAVSQRLRRATANLVENTLVDSDPLYHDIGMSG